MSLKKKKNLLIKAGEGREVCVLGGTIWVWATLFFRIKLPLYEITFTKWSNITYIKNVLEIMSTNSREVSYKNFRPHGWLFSLWEELQRWSRETTRQAMKYERYHGLRKGMVHCHLISSKLSYPCLLKN